MVILYDNPVSSNALKVRFLAAEMRLDYERRLVSMARPRDAAYLALNPVGGIPTLVDGDFVLTESHAILCYLAMREGRDDLYPSDGRDRAQVDEFLDRWATGLRTAMFRHEGPALGYVAAIGFDDSARDPAAAAAVVPQISGALTLLDSLVSAEGAVLERFTIADCAIAPALYRTLHTGLDLEPYPNLAGLRTTLLARPAWLRADPVL